MSTVTTLLHSVRKLLEDGASLDLKRWLAAAEQAADRSGLALCHDLEDRLHADPSRGAASRRDRYAVTRCRDLSIYSVSPEYLAPRERAGRQHRRGLRKKTARERPSRQDCARRSRAHSGGMRAWLWWAFVASGVYGAAGGCSDSSAPPRGDGVGARGGK